MITIISGTPGAGKTLYTIEKLLLPLVGTTVKGRAADGSEVEHPRTIYTNINGLQVDHELIDGGDNQGLRDWHTWAKPGSVIVFDEVQKVWPPRANGAKVPDDIQALDTHRHMGVDFILITQNVINLDKHIHALGGRHLHVRRIANMPLAVVYEWDHVSRGLMFSKSISKAPWRYDKKVFKLYKSAELHTKQQRRIPGLVWFILAGLVSIVVLAPTLKARMEERFNPKPKEAQKADKPSTQVQALGPGVASLDASFIDDRVAFLPRISNKPETAPAYDGLRVVINMPQVSGGVCFKGVCKCVTQQGTDAGLSHGECKAWMENRPFDNYRQQVIAVASVAPVGNPSESKPSVEGRTAPAPAQVSTVPGPSGYENPRADARPALVLPPGSPVHPEPAMGVAPSIAPPSLLSPYRRS